MKPAWRRTLVRLRRDEGGLTLVELLVAAMLSVILLAAVSSMVISSMKTQPKISERNQDVSTARFALERMTREIRNGLGGILETSPSKVSFLTYVRRTACGGGVATSSTTPAIKCQVTYQCTTTACSRIESAAGSMTGTPRTVLTGLNSSQVFCYVPSTATDPLTCGTAKSKAETTYIGIVLQMPNPTGSATALNISDGASLRNATLTK
ncbi:MAG TPA: prepilin-type N-terminal cleavage/methylation domain-containing protein [Solirubrobacterales bacterium]